MANEELVQDKDIVRYFLKGRNVYHRCFRVEKTSRNFTGNCFNMSGIFSMFSTQISRLHFFRCSIPLAVEHFLELVSLGSLHASFCTRLFSNQCCWILMLPYFFFFWISPANDFILILPNPFRCRRQLSGLFIQLHRPRQSCRCLCLSDICLSNNFLRAT